MQIKETIGVSFPGSAETPPLEDVVVLADSAGVAFGVQHAFSAKVRAVRPGGVSIASRCVEIPLVGGNGQISGVLCQSMPPSDVRGALVSRGLSVEAVEGLSIVSLICMSGLLACDRSTERRLRPVREGGRRWVAD